MMNGAARMRARGLAMVLDRHLCGRGEGFGITRLSDLSGKPVKTIQNWTAGVCSPSVVDLLLIVDAIEVEDPARAAALWADVSSLVRQASSPLPPPDESDSPAPLVLRLQGEVGAVSAGAADAMQNGDVDDVEAEREERKVRKVQVWAAKLVSWYRHRKEARRKQRELRFTAEARP